VQPLFVPLLVVAGADGVADGLADVDCFALGDVVGADVRGAELPGADVPGAAATTGSLESGASPAAELGRPELHATKPSTLVAITIAEPPSHRARILKDLRISTESGRATGALTTSCEIKLQLEAYLPRYVVV
jgi:hypothetical protein